MLRHSAYCLVLSALAAAQPGALLAAEVSPQEGLVVEDLPYGYVLYEYYQEDYFTALTQLLVEEHFGRIDNNISEAELLRGGLMLSYGLHSDATPIFERLLTNDIEPVRAKDKKARLKEQQIRDRAWFFLGKVLFQRGYINEAGEALGRTGDHLPEHLAQERNALLSQVYLETNQLPLAEALLKNWQGSESWQNYAAYNLGAALLRENRLEDGAVYLEAVGTAPASSEEMRSLRDRANLALGFGWLRQENGAEAKLALERVRLSGPFSGSALLGYGWADAAQGNYRDALVPWLELRDRQSIGAAYQESLLAIPYAYRKLNANQQAAESYQLAIDVYDDEIKRLDKAIAAARNGELTRQFIATDVEDFSRWNWSLSDLPDTDEARYLYEVVASNEFQAGLRNYRDLIMIRNHLNDWRGRLSTFGDIVASRREAYAAALQSLPGDLYSAEVASQRSRYQHLIDTLATAEANRDVVALANAKETKISQRIAALENDPGFANADPEVQEKLRVLKGLAYWDMERDYKYRVWQQQRQIDSVGEMVASAQLDHARFVRQLTAIPEKLDDYDFRAQYLTPQVDALLAQVNDVARAQINELGAIAATELVSLRERVQQYRSQAQFAQAAIYDSSRVSAEPAQ